MPCNLIVQNAVDLGTCDRATLIEALKEMSDSVVDVNGTITFATKYGVGHITNGELVMRGSSAPYAETVRDMVKQGVMKKAIEKAGKKFGWKTEAVKGTNKIKIKHS